MNLDRNDTRLIYHGLVINILTQYEEYFTRKGGAIDREDSEALESIVECLGVFSDAFKYILWTQNESREVSTAAPLKKPKKQKGQNDS